MEMTTRMELRPVSELIPYARNAREHSEVQIRQLRSSLREFGFVAPLLIDAQGNILAGHGRLAAAEAEGLERVPCVLVEHLTATQRRAYILADNRLAEQASWDAELVSLELQELRDAGFELDLTGFDASDILLEDPPEAGEDGYVPELPEEPRSKQGEVYQMGRHRLMCGDATRAEDVARLMGGVRAQLLLTDPPYNVDYTGYTSRRMKMKNDALGGDAYEAFLYLRATKHLFEALAAGTTAEADKWSSIQDRFFRQCRSAGADLGLTVSGRCSLELPPSQVEEASREEAELFGD